MSIAASSPETGCALLDRRDAPVYSLRQVVDVALRRDAVGSTTPGPPSPPSLPAGHAGKCGCCGAALLAGESITCDRCDRHIDDFGGDLY